MQVLFLESILLFIILHHTHITFVYYSVFATFAKNAIKTCIKWVFWVRDNLEHGSW